MADVSKQINDVMDNVCKKLGLAADKIMPFIDKLFDDYRGRHFAYAAIGLVFILIGIFVCKKLNRLGDMYKKRAEALESDYGRGAIREDETTCRVIGIVVFGIFTFVGALIMCIQTAAAMSPHLGLLEDVLKACK